MITRTNKEEAEIQKLRRFRDVLKDEENTSLFCSGDGCKNRLECYWFPRNYPKSFQSKLYIEFQENPKDNECYQEK